MIKLERAEEKYYIKSPKNACMVRLEDFFVWSDKDIVEWIFD